MNKHLPAAALTLLLCGFPALSPAAPAQDARDEYEALTQPYLEAYRAFLKARLTGAPDLETRRQAYETAYSAYLKALRSRGQSASATSGAIQDLKGATMSASIATPPETLSATPPTPLLATATSPAPLPSPETASASDPVSTTGSAPVSAGMAPNGSGSAPTP